MFCNKSHAFAYLPIHLCFVTLSISLSFHSLFFSHYLWFSLKLNFLSAFFPYIRFILYCTLHHFSLRTLPSFVLISILGYLIPTKNPLTIAYNYFHSEFFIQLKYYIFYFYISSRSIYPYITIYLIIIYFV